MEAIPGEIIQNEFSSLPPEIKPPAQAKSNK